MQSFSLHATSRAKFEEIDDTTIENDRKEAEDDKRRSQGRREIEEDFAVEELLHLSVVNYWKKSKSSSNSI